jgi:hypothetical protein
MKFLSKLYIWVVPILTGIIFSERLISYFVVKQIPKELILRTYPSSNGFSFDIILISKLLPFIILSLIILLFSRRFKYRYLLFPMLGGLIGILIPYIKFIFWITEYWITSPRLSSTSSLEYLVIPIKVFPGTLVGIFIGLSALLFYGYYKWSDNLQFYQSFKKRKTYLVEGLVYLVLAVTITTGFNIWNYPYRLEEKASSVRTSERKLEHYFRNANEQSNYKLLSTLATNPVLPVQLLEEIYHSGTTLLASGNDQYLKIYNSLALNRKTPQHILFDVSKLNIVSINANLSLNPNTPGEILIALTNDFSGARKIWLARNPNTPSEALAILSGEQNYVVRRFVAGHKNVTEEILKNLINDKDERVRNVAIREIKKFQK